MTDATAPVRQPPKLTRFVVPDLCNAPALGIVVLVGQLLVIVLLFAGGPVTWARFGLTSLFVQWVALASAGALCLSRTRLISMGLIGGALASFGIVLLVTLIVGLMSDRILAGSVSLQVTGIHWIKIGTQMAISGIITGMVLRYFYVQEQLREQEQSELQSRIQALQSRIRPHFLFNSMNIIASLIPTEPETAESVVEDLSELFRASLNEAGNQVPISEELALCERYVRIEGLRLGDRLKIRWDICEYPSALKIPLLTLQPLLENAIYHGIQPLPEGGTVEVKLRYDGEIVNVEISNPMPPLQSRGLSKGNQMAINNIKSRLSVLYGNTAALAVETRDEIYVTTLRYPFRADG